jgi:hypothetical protein
MEPLKRGMPISVLDYKCNSDGTCSKILRPAEITLSPKSTDELIFVKFLDERFRKGGRSLHSVQVLRKNITIRSEV